MASKSQKRRKKRRRRAQGGADSAPAEEQQAPKRSTAREAQRRRSAGADERPPAPWGSFPLIELTVLAGIVLLILGFVMDPTDRGQTFLLTGLVLASIGGLELSIREHFAGYRSHTAILAGFPAAVVLGVLFYAGPDDFPVWARIAAAALTFAATALVLVRTFRARSGGLSFRLSGFRRD